MALRLPVPYCRGHDVRPRREVAIVRATHGVRGARKILERTTMSPRRRRGDPREQSWHRV